MKEEVVYSDDFKIGLHELLKANKTKSPLQLAALLDENGYVGRYKIKRKYKNCCPLNEVNILVRLIWSNVEYKWPVDGTYSFTYNWVLPDLVPLRIDYYTSAALRYMFEHMIGGPNLLARGTSIPLTQAESIVNTLDKLGIVKRGKLRIVNGNELEEVIENLLTVKY